MWLACVLSLPLAGTGPVPACLLLTSDRPSLLQAVILSSRGAFLSLVNFSFRFRPHLSILRAFALQQSCFNLLSRSISPSLSIQCILLNYMCVCVCVCVRLHYTEQLESFKKHMDAGETNIPAIILGEENEEDVENGLYICLSAICVLGSPYLTSNSNFVCVCACVCVCVCVCHCRRERARRQGCELGGPQQPIRGAQ